VQMPVMDGFEATAAIRSGETKVPDPRIPIIAMTAHAMKGDRERCLAAGMDDYLSKPLAPKAVAAMLDKWLSLSSKQPVATPVAAAPDGPAVFDRPALVERLLGDRDLVKEIIAGFLADMPGQMKKLADFIGRGEVKAAGDKAHAIKGAAANIGAPAFSAAALAIEHAARDGNLDKVSVLLPEMERQFDLLRERLLEKEDENTAG